MCVFFFKQKTAYEMRISDWSSDVCSSDLRVQRRVQKLVERRRVDARNRLLLGDQPLVRHVDRDLERGLGGALAAPGLEHPELALLHRELDEIGRAHV